MTTKNIGKLIHQLQKEIQYCETCQPYDEGEVVWVLGVKNDLESLFDEYDVPENLRDEIILNLYCPNCGRQFERYDDYGGKTEHEKLIDQKYREWNARYKEDLQDFMQFISMYPYLGANHKIGKKIIALMPEFPATEITNENWFRARKISDGRKFSQNDMRAPDPGIVQINEGRFNHFGQSHFYLAKTDIGATKELLAFSDEELVWIQKIIIHHAKAILDVRVGFHEPDPDAPIIALGIIHFSNVLSSIVEKGKFWKPEYFIPRFIADVAKLAGFEGILYTSTHTYLDNLVIFDPSKLEYEFNGEPYIYTLQENISDNRIQDSINSILGI